MRKHVLFAVAAVAAVFSANVAFAQSAGSFSAQIANGTIIPLTVCETGSFSNTGQLTCSNNAHNFLSLSIKTSSGSGTSLLVGGSLQSQLVTNTSVTGGNGKQTAVATGSVQVVVTVDGETVADALSLVGCSSNCPAGVAYPPSVTYNERQQTLSATLGQVCSTSAGVTTCSGNEAIQLILNTTTANSFNFVIPGLSVGTHTVNFYIYVAADGSSTSLSAGSEAAVVVGVGSLTAQVVKVQTPNDSITLGTGTQPTWSF
jgi:hypothetical protein